MSTGLDTLIELAESGDSKPETNHSSLTSSRSHASRGEKREEAVSRGSSTNNNVLEEEDSKKGKAAVRKYDIFSLIYI